MKTYNGTSITKKEIQQIIRTQDVRQIFHLCHRIYGGKVERKKVNELIKTFAPSERARRNAYSIAYLRTNAEKRTEQFATLEEIDKRHDFNRANAMHRAMNELRYEMSYELDGYNKVPTMGHTHLYFCHPGYGHDDYNKRCMLEIQGHERFCELLCIVGQKFIQRALMARTTTNSNNILLS